MNYQNSQALRYYAENGLGAERVFADGRISSVSTASADSVLSVAWPGDRWNEGEERMLVSSHEGITHFI
jgi:hypothetical protein